MIICTCHAVRLEEIRSLVARGEVATVEDLAALTSAGQGCGGCWGNLEDVFRELQNTETGHEGVLLEPRLGNGAGV